MSRTGIGGSLDARVGALAERAMRRISRRDALRGISGSGTFSVTITAIYARLASGACGTRFAVFQQLTYEGGTVRR